MKNDDNFAALAALGLFNSSGQIGYYLLYNNLLEDAERESKGIDESKLR